MSDLSTLREIRREVRKHLPRRVKVHWMTYYLPSERYQAGQANYDHGKGCFVALYFSRSVWPLLDEAGRREMILHEVAHALLPVEAEHGKAWQEMHRSLGGSGVEMPALLSESVLSSL